MNQYQHPCRVNPSRIALRSAKTESEPTTIGDTVQSQYTTARIGVAAALSVGIAFAIVVLTRFLREFTHAGLEGRKFIHYYSLFLPGLWVLLVVVVLAFRNKPQRDRIWLWALTGMLAGYASGVISVTFIELFHPDGWVQVVIHSQRFENWVTRLGYPVVSLNWLVGLIAGVVGNGINRLRV